jgi:hypothetical protein
MKKFTISNLAFLLLFPPLMYAQNVGIGINIPQAKLHVFNTGTGLVLTETNDAGQYAGFEAKTNGGLNDRLIIRKNGASASGSIAGVDLANLSLIGTGAQAGALMVGVITANPLYFTSANQVRLQINADGKIGVNDNLPQALFSVKGRSDVVSTALFADNTTTGQRTVLAGYVHSTGPGSAGVLGLTFEGGGVGGLELQTYGVAGLSGSSGIAVGAYSLSSTALRGQSNSGYALFTSGKVKLNGIGEGAGKVLTSNASGEATWSTLPSGAGAWTTNGNNIYNNNSGYVGINNNAPAARLDIRNPNADSLALKITYGGSRKTEINGSRQLYHEGDLWVQSNFGILRLGFADRGWYWSTINGGTDLQLWSHGTSDLTTSKVNRVYIDGSTGNVGINTNNYPAVYGKLIVDRNADMNGALIAYNGVVTGLNSSATDGSGIYGISSAPRTGVNSYAGVSGYNQNTGTDRFGVIGISAGTTSGSVYSAGVGGYGDYGILGYSQSTTGAGIIAQHGAGKTALEINNGFLKVTGADNNKTAFSITATAGNSSGYVLNLPYSNQSATDILIVTHNFNPGGIGGTYLNHPYSVWWTGSTWTIFLDDFSAIFGESFNVLVIKQ